MKKLLRRIARVFAHEMVGAQAHLLKRHLAEQQAVLEQNNAALASEIADELERRQLTQPHDRRAKIDLVDLLQQSTTRQANAELQKFFTMNHRWVTNLSERNRRAAISTFDYIEGSMGDALFTLSQFDYIETRPELIDQVDGSILDLGVYKGGSTRALARIYPNKTIHGFDSFEGLPEDWSYVLKGDFGEIEGALPDVPDNVKLYKGWFEDTLPGWAEAHGDQPISILRVDCDIYSSTKTIFDELGHLLRPGTFVVFDELIGYWGWERHEYKAFMEFLEDHPFGVKYHAYGLTYTIVELTEAD